MPEKLTKKQALIISAYTMTLMTNFGDFHEYVEKVLGRPVWTHQMGNKELAEELAAAVKDEFLELLPEKL